MKYYIEISDDTSESLSISLEDILRCFNHKDEYHWVLLWIDGLITKKGIDTILGYQSVVDFETAVNKSKKGIKMPLDDIQTIDSSTDQILNLLLLSDKNIKNIKRFKQDEEMYDKCSSVIELVDGAYWEICTDNNEFVDNIFQNLKEAKIFFR